MSKTNNSIRNKLKKQTEKLNLAAQKATEELEEHSSWLSENGPGIPIESLMYEEENGGKGKEFYLAYDRHGDGWKILIRVKPYHYEDFLDKETGDYIRSVEKTMDQSMVYDISSAPRLARITATEYIDDFMEALSRETQGLIDKMKK